ncbi:MULTISPECIES: L-ribulose-5-phosphate 3-epimerase [Aerococcus]|uniref:L-ribulose-5-phosphate 3-epimerase n=1 Tax=Aerococcus urinae TaxID=1376 RepID=A0A2I1L685_9LACT|nr:MULTISPECIES: L-ribulose-5-phosphate 3-epimerase [Aerococcus]KAA9219201.1 L-ribulose-5-phosphate 3-epimerase [Aerococcus loyolae]KAA9266666.1 L-ribulose-5-phosphate 3-epimerase [Aerococcus loyolae]MCY3067780.1 L-ribulose-5-phosphate 3-epimerase [Aerococcus mictus]MCY3080320.1 L-ribulose-5-phosphate 3-epimerase [Aerococcus mictus]MCY3084100.1 L-ribulose-5-phosphate 3-epimerase [Aerococcus mictus]
MVTLGIYEKALPKNITWLERLQLAKELGFQFVEMSVDESDERLARLDWTKEERKKVVDAMYETGVRIFSICLSGHRRYPFGSSDPKIREHALEMMEKAIDLAVDLGVRNIQLAGYDVYYEEKTLTSRAFFMENLKKAVHMAASKQVMLSIEIMDDPFINSVTKFNRIKSQIHSPWLQVYPDLGNISAWPENDVAYELELGIDEIVALHVKDTKNVTDDYPGKFKEVPFGEGDVDFLGCFKTLKQLDYHGTFMIEMWSETSDDPAEEIKKAKDYVLPIMKEAGFNV